MALILIYTVESRDWLLVTFVPNYYIFCACTIALSFPTSFIFSLEVCCTVEPRLRLYAAMALIAVLFTLCHFAGKGVVKIVVGLGN